MESICLPLIALVVVGILLLVLAAGVLLLIQLGVITQYALKEEPEDQASYELDQSGEAGEG